MIKLFAIAIVLAAVSSRLILPSDLVKNLQRSHENLNPSLKTRSAPEDNNSYAKPVQGIANATSGYLSVNDPKTKSKLFFIFYSCRNMTSGQKASDIPIVIWLQGGPGGSSQIGNFMEMGPWQLTYNPKTGKYQETPRQLSWNDYYHLLVIDNPRGTGYSIADQNSYVQTEDQVAEDFLQALINFYSLPDFAGFKNTPLYIFGESYAGHYIPSISKRIIQYNSQKPSLSIPLKGMGIGDGWTDPINQLPLNGLFAYSLGLLDDVERAKVEAFQTTGIYNIKNKNWKLALTAFDNIMNTIVQSGGNVNVYNFRDFGDYDFSFIEKFMNDADTVQRYNVDPSVAGHFKEENTAVYTALTNDFMQSVADRVAFVLQSNLSTLIYNGQDDIICNSPNQQNWVGNLSWSRQTEFYNTPFQVWLYANQTMAGLAKQTGPLTFTIVNKAGHLAPMDQINTTTEMLRRFIGGSTNWTNPLTY